MTRTRKTSITALVIAAISLGAIGGCPAPVVVGFTIATKTFAFVLGSTGILRALANATEPTRKGGVVSLPFDDTPTDRPASGQLSLNAGSTRALSLNDSAKPLNQQGLTGEASLRVHIGSATDSNPCETGTFVGTFELSFADGVVTSSKASLNLPAAALTHVITGEFTICLELTSTVDVQLEISEMSVKFGPAGTPDDTSDDITDNADDPGDQTDDPGDDQPDDDGDDDSDSDLDQPDDPGDDDPDDPDEPEDVFTTAQIIHRGSEQIIAGPEVDASVSTVTPAGYAATGYKAVALSGDGSKVWFALYDEFPNVPGDPQTRLWSVNIDGSAGVQSPLPAEDLRYSLKLETSQDGTVCFADNSAAKKMYRATSGHAPSTAFTYWTENDGWIYGDIRGEFKITDDASHMVYRSYVDTKIYGVDLTGGSGTPAVLADGNTVAYNGHYSRTFGSRIDLAGDGSKFVFVAEYWHGDWDPQLQYVMWIGDGFAPGATFTPKTVPQPGVEVASYLNITDDESLIAYTVDPEYLGAPAPVYIQPTGGNTRDAFTDGRTAMAFSLSDHGNRIYARTARQYGNGNSLLIDVDTNHRAPAGTGLFDDQPGVDCGNVRLSDDGQTLVAGSSRGIWTLRDGTEGLAGFPSIDAVRFRTNEDCTMTIRVTVTAPRGVHRIYVTPYIEGEPPTTVVDGEQDPTYSFRWGSWNFEEVAGETGIWQQTVGLTNSAGACAQDLLNGDFVFRVVLYDANQTMAVFKDFAPGS